MEYPGIPYSIALNKNNVLKNPNVPLMNKTPNIALNLVNKTFITHLCQHHTPPQQISITISFKSSSSQSPYNFSSKIFEFKIFDIIESDIENLLIKKLFLVWFLRRANSNHIILNFNRCLKV